MKLKSGAHLEERAGKEVYLVIGENEILPTGMPDKSRRSFITLK